MNPVAPRLLLLSLLVVSSEQFFIDLPLQASRSARTRDHQDSRSSALHAQLREQTFKERARRQELLARDGPYFKLNRMSGDVAFGSAAKLVTRLDDEPNSKGISEWLTDGQGLAMSIWDEKLLTDLGNSVYRLQTMKLQFVTIQLSPTVDMQIWTQLENSDPQSPVFLLQSIAYDPNIQIFPGVGVPASQLGIEIEVVGELRPSRDGTGVTGTIAFQTTGILPPPMRILPEPLLKLTSDSINETLVKFAVQSFQKGAIAKYKEFQRSQSKA